MNLPTGTRGKLVALAILLIILILIVEYAVRPGLQSYQRIDDEIADMRQNILRMQHLLSRIPALEAATAKLKRNNPLTPVTLTGSNAALAAAELQQLIQKAAAADNVRIVSLRVRQTEVEKDNFESITVEARLQADIAGLRNILFKLETNTRYIFTKQLRIRARSSARQKAQAGILDVTLEVYGMHDRSEPNVTPASRP